MSTKLFVGNLSFKTTENDLQDAFAALRNGLIPLPVLLYFHGGGFTIGSVATHDTLCRHLSHLARCAVVSLDYRLAPQWQFPTAFDDAWDALAWLAGQGDELGLDTTRLAVGGDSAGGTLAAASAIAL